VPEAEKSELYGPGIPPVRLQLNAEGQNLVLIYKERLMWRF